MIKVVFDLDGVLRDLNGTICKKLDVKYPDKWEYLYNGKTIYEIINSDLSILTECNPTKYLHVVLEEINDIEIWTNQPENWRDLTVQWIKKHIGKCKIYFKTTSEKEACVNDGMVLIEDSPKFNNYDNIILIDRPYNQEVFGAFRIFGPHHLRNVLQMIKHRNGVVNESKA
jgi:hypothetical protein